MAKSKAWQALERDTADFFGVKRNIKRGMDWSIVDTDVDVIEEDDWHTNYIIDCKYRTGSEGNLCKVMQKVVKAAKRLTPVIIYQEGSKRYLVLRLEDMKDDIPLLISHFVNDYYYIHTELARKGTSYITRWFEKMNNTYVPLKEKEYNVQVEPLMTVRMKGVRQTIIIIEVN